MMAATSIGHTGVTKNENRQFFLLLHPYFSDCAIGKLPSTVYSTLGYFYSRESILSETTSIAKMNFETALAELEKIVSQLESGDVELEQSITLYERGAKLREACENKLAQAKLKVDKIVLDGSGNLSAQPSDMDVK